MHYIQRGGNKWINYKNTKDAFILLQALTRFYDENEKSGIGDVKNKNEFLENLEIIKTFDRFTMLYDFSNIDEGIKHLIGWMKNKNNELQKIILKEIIFDYLNYLTLQGKKKENAYNIFVNTYNQDDSILEFFKENEAPRSYILDNLTRHFREPDMVKLKILSFLIESPLWMKDLLQDLENVTIEYMYNTCNDAYKILIDFDKTTYYDESFRRDLPVFVNNGKEWIMKQRKAALDEKKEAERRIAREGETEELKEMLEIALLKIENSERQETNLFKNLEYFKYHMAQNNERKIRQYKEKMMKKGMPILYGNKYMPKEFKQKAIYRSEMYELCENIDNNKIPPEELVILSDILGVNIKKLNWEQTCLKVKEAIEEKFNLSRRATPQKTREQLNEEYEESVKRDAKLKAEKEKHAFDKEYKDVSLQLDETLWDRDKKAWKEDLADEEKRVNPNAIINRFQEEIDEDENVARRIEEGEGAEGGKRKKARRGQKCKICKRHICKMCKHMHY